MSIVLVVGLFALSNLQVTTRQGLNYEVSTHRLPLYAKGLQFIDRHIQYGQIAVEVTAGVSSDEARVMRIFEWTKRNIRQTPDGWPIVDDHILNIIVRGHGVSDQQADVFTTLSAYAGMPAFWQEVRATRTKDGLILSFARVGNRWAVFDVLNGFAFRTRDGVLATADDLGADPAVLPDAARAITVGSTPYPKIVEGLRTPPVPRPLRAELQMPWPRLRYESARVAGLERNNGSER